VTLPAGSRVADAIAAAGGALRPGDIATIDLAAKVADGQLVLVGVPGAATGGEASAAGPVDINTATVDQLDALPGVGPVLAQRIVDYREAHGGFRSVDDLQQVPGIGARKFADLKNLVTA
jgi:competence protein ComEA